ncbi:non-ribosomal peptide synthetase [Acrocarpospora catenulata]|uniref:non-ribosomal peptide synthetase n=1 Tax=Acrocarpospora catenulata TaxID=2836182 RepID=UPI001BD938EA|nr:non-ribosomal peptide synthetase [Acrocarpospora catenulata]
MIELPLTAAQERVWFLQQVDPRDASYHLSHTTRLTGPIDPDLLARGLTAIVARHQALRARFPAGDGGPVQVIDPPWRVELTRVTLDGPAERLVSELVERPFDLAEGRLLRAWLVECGPDEHVLSLVTHHIVADGRSIGIIADELTTLYEAYRTGAEPDLPPLPVEYADVLTVEPESEESLAYWTGELTGAPPLELATDRPRPAVATSTSAHLLHALPDEVTGPFAALIARERCTVFMGLMAVYQVLLAGRSGQLDFCVGFPTAGRDKEELEQLVGYFSNTVVIRAELGGDPTFREILRRTRKRLLAGYRHQRVPFERLLAALDIERDLSRAPLFQTMFGMHHQTGGPGLQLSGVVCERADAGFGQTPYELKVDIFGLSGIWQLLLVYNKGLFDEATAVGYAQEFQELLARVGADPDLRLSELTAPTGAERERLLHGWNRTAPAATEPVLSLFDRQVRLRPAAIAVSSGDTRLSYAELDRRATDLAARLPVRPGDAVAVCLPRTAESLVALLAVQRTGARYVPIDPAYPASRISFVLEDCGASLVLATTETAGALPGHGLPTVLADDPPPAAFSFTPVAARGADTAYVLYTSGSTGRPKGVRVPHAALANLLADMAERVGSAPEHVWLGLTSLSFDISALELYLPLVTGGRLEIADAATSLDGFAQARLIKEAGVTHVQATPSGWRMLLDSGFRDTALTALVGGEALGAELARRLRASVGRLVNVYGPTETTIWSTSWEVPEQPAAVRIGGPIRATQVYVLDERLNPVRQGVPGELLIGGAGVAHGYHGRPALTAERFVPDPYGAPGGRLYRTGDLVRWRPGGELEFLGRNDNQVKVRGHRIELGEVEAACEAQPGVVQAVAAVHEENLIAYIVGEVSLGALSRALAGILPAHLVPARFIRLPKLPLTPNGKVDRKALPSPAALRAEFVPPRTDAEALVADVWSEVLAVPRVGAHDDFFRLGGQSLLAVRVAARLLAITGVELPILTMFTRRTVADLAIAVEEGLAAELAGMTDEEAERLLGGE